MRVPLAVVPLVVAAVGERKAGPLFRTRSGKRQTKGLVTKAFRRLLRGIGLKCRNLHALRHSVGTLLISAGVPIGDVAAFLGDRVSTVVENYLHPAGTDPADAMDRLLGVASVSAAPPTRTNPSNSRDTIEK